MTRLRRTWPQRLLIAFNIFLIAVCLVTAGGIGYVYSKAGDIKRIALAGVLSPSGDALGTGSGSGPENFLVVGTDSAEGLDPNDPVLIGRDQVGLHSDTIMVLRLDPSSGQAWILSLPRDLWVPIAGTHHKQRINTAVQGGPERLIETIKDYLNVPIQHYVEIDFAGFKSLVEAVDGVPMYFATPVRDLKSGLNVPDAGCVTLSGDQALAFARARAYQTYENGRWHTDPTGDLGRISRQQDFIRRSLRRAVAKGVRNPSVLDDLIDVGTKSITLDDELTAGDLVSLGSRFRSFNPDNLALYSVPTTDAIISGAAVLLMQEDDAEPILDIFRGIDPGQLTPSSVRLQVQNGTGAPGEAGRVAQEFRDAGFQISSTADADRFDYSQSVLLYRPENEAAARLVARYVDPGAELREVPYLPGAQVALITGADLAGVRSTPLPATASTTTSTTTRAGPTSSTSSTSSTTVIGEVPPEPPAGVHC